ncbi:YggS family pyridoxal phosphate-dependent enzyme [Riemerella columbina]|uniref:YggS family pyridoxal phosphate-dependent enzyme n=1 Tax=Riemerella columbina TaxID=103810 RepID=UPI0003720D81|nr:YggS family pyridoxal phosphate-dependent enzyme [Riemerella columbina]
MDLVQNYQHIISQLPNDVQLVAVSKTHPIDKIQTVYDEGQRVFGENKVQEMIAKQPELPQDIEWHLIGHLQTNKVKYIAPFVALIQSVDSEKLLKEIQKQAKKHNRSIPILLQIKIAEEESKTGIAWEDAQLLTNKMKNRDFPNIELKGLMGIATFTDDEAQVEREFKFLKQCYDELSKEHPLTTLSMGMSGDYELAIACGANSVRIGSAIFGHRNYTNEN